MFWKLLIPFFTVLVLLACNGAGSETSSDKPVEMRVVVESEGSNNALFKVYLEGSDGNILTGAVVLMTDTLNRTLKLDFDSDLYCYRGSAQIFNDETLFFSAETLAFSGPVTLSVPHTILTTKPVVNIFQDEDGKSVFSGETLSSDKGISVAWNPSWAGAVYQVYVKTSLKTVYFTSSSGPGIIIPPSSIPPGSNYFLQVTAQKMYGDPFFLSSDYYSVSVIRGENIMFSVQ